MEMVHALLQTIVPVILVIMGFNVISFTASESLISTAQPVVVMETAYHRTPVRAVLDIRVATVKFQCAME